MSKFIKGGSFFWGVGGHGEGSTGGGVLGFRGGPRPPAQGSRRTSLGGGEGGPGRGSKRGSKKGSKKVSQKVGKVVGIFLGVIILYPSEGSLTDVNQVFLASVCVYRGPLNLCVPCRCAQGSIKMDTPSPTHPQTRSPVPR